MIDRHSLLRSDDIGKTRSEFISILEKRNGFCSLAFGWEFSSEVCARQANFADLTDDFTERETGKWFETMILHDTMCKLCLFLMSSLKLEKKRKVFQ